MLKITVIVAMVLLVGVAQAQITDIPVTADSTVKINSVYAGLLSSTGFSYDSLSLSPASTSTSLVTGFMASYQPLSWLSVHSIEAYYVNNAGKSGDFHRFWFKMRYDNLVLSSGLLSSQSTRSRPLIITGDGQFEDWTQSQIPGGALGATLDYYFNGNCLGFGIAKRNNHPEYQARLAGEHLMFTAYYPEFKKKPGYALELKYDGFHNVTVYNVGEVMANFTSVTLSQKQQLDIYLDAGHSFQSDKTVRFELGLLKSFESRLLKGLIGVAYNYETRSIIGYVFVHI